MKTSLFISLLWSASLVFAGAAHADAGHHHADSDDAIGQPGLMVDVTRTVKIDMGDNMRFTPADIRVRQGETVRFLVSNSGKLKHEMVIGSAAQLAQHAALMRKMPEMEHEDPNQVTVEPGKNDELVWKFDRTGTVDFACLEPGHYEASMVGKIVAAPAKASSN
ncbi:putative cupredoxin-like copper-binding protein [Collimonas sp. PA-H2]|uniref:cupredoxin domain-containing protein n=1 Tax=Collimonas sp. PA-H2 TaxID=1881062 RepID=UPI000BF2A977|nr:cupredoxin family protein [Collimonas sp. PA-H2]PFH11398.1 putative cupredoxin-like copper-binding protein [Collimonas sp. PA-H2]